MDIHKIQNYLQEHEVDGWLLYDHHGSNRVFGQLVKINPHQVMTRRVFYWIPKRGETQKIVHRIEAENLDLLPGRKNVYLSWQELEKALASVLRGSKRIFMEYSPRCANPNISFVDCGTIEVINEFGIEVLSSADLVQLSSCVLNEKQITSHLEAAHILEKTVERVWNWISETKGITEFDVQNFIRKEIAENKAVCADGPICAVNENSALPHYMASAAEAKTLKSGDFILIDLWCKKESSDAIYADICRVAVLGKEPTQKQLEVFEIVKTAQKKGFEFVQGRIRTNKIIRGFEVDDVCRKFIAQSGYGEFFTHRTGHNIDTNVHGSGANLDNLETSDYRELLSGMCFSIEPGIYLPGEFGIRLESDLLINHDRTVKITGGVQEKIVGLN